MVCREWYPEESCHCSDTGCNIVTCEVKVSHRVDTDNLVGKHIFVADFIVIHLLWVDRTYRDSVGWIKI